MEPVWGINVAYKTVTYCLMMIYLLIGIFILMKLAKLSADCNQ